MKSRGKTQLSDRGVKPRLHFAIRALMASIAAVVAFGTIGVGAAFATGETITSLNNSGQIFVVGEIASFTISTTGFSCAPTFSLGSGSFPTGIGMSSSGGSTASISGEPVTGTAGTYSLGIDASCSGESASQDFTLYVNNTSAPVFTSAINSGTTFQVGQYGDFTVTTQPYYPTPTFTTDPLPSGLTLDSLGDLTGTAGAGTGGSYAITIHSSVGGVSSTTQSFSLIVDQAPIITSTNSATFTGGTVGTFDVTSTAYPSPAGYALVGAPTGVTLNASGVLSDTTSTPPGNYSFTVIANNGVSPTDNQSFTLKIQATTPVFTSASSTNFSAGSAGTFTVTASGDPSPTFAVANGSTLPSGVSLNSSTGVLSGTVATTGSYTFVITATNTATTVTQNFTLTVVMKPVFTSPASDIVTNGTNANFQFASNGDSSSTTTYAFSGSPPSGITLSNSGLLTGFAAQGSYPLTVQATNDAGTTTQSFTLTFGTYPGFTSPNTMTFTAGVAGSFSVVTDGSPSTNSLSESGSLPSGVTFFNFENGTGTLSGTPSSSSVGQWTFTITANNGLSASQSFTITVNQAPSITSSSTITTTAGQAFSGSIVAVGYPAPTLSVTGIPAGVTYTPGTTLGSGTVAGTIANAPSSPYVVTVVASNTLKSVTQYLVITVNAAVIPSTPPLEPFILNGRQIAIPSKGRQPVLRAGKLSARYNPIKVKGSFTARAEGTKIGYDPKVFPVLGNATTATNPIAVGDCAIVAVNNVVHAMRANGKISLKLPKVTTTETVAEWHKLNGNTTAGLTDKQLLTAWMSKSGILGTRITGFAKLNVLTPSQIESAIKADGAVFATTAIPLSTGSLFNKIWPVAMAPSTIPAGHDLALVGWTTGGFVAATWGSEVIIPFNFFSQYAMSAYALKLSTHTVKISR